jgi:hypothetical protein
MSGKSDPTRKANSNSRLKNLDEETQARIAEWCAEDGLSATASRCLAELQISTNRDSLSKWLKWRKDVLPLKQHFDSADSQAKAATELLKQVDPTSSAEKLRAFGQLMFMAKAVETKNAEDFVAVGRLGLQAQELEAKINGFKATYGQKERTLKFETEKWRASLRTKIEQGLEALKAELVGNSKAEAIFRQLTEALRA